MTEIAAINEIASIAAGLNSLAKLLTLPAQKEEAYRLKATACGTAVMLGQAVVDGNRAGGIVGVRIFSAPPIQMHVKVSHLQPAARAAVRLQAPFVPAKAPVKERLNAGQIEMLRDLAARKGAKR